MMMNKKQVDFWHLDFYMDFWAIWKICQKMGKDT